MGTFLGNGYHKVVWTWTLDGSTKIFQTVMMGASGTSTTAAQLSTAYRNSFCAASRPFNANNMYVGYTLAKTEVTRQDGGVVTQLIDETPIVGTLASSLGTPINTSILIKKSTGLVGRRYQGRLMLPNLTIPENTISQAGLITEANRAGYEALWTNAVTALAGTFSGLIPVLGHSSSEVLPTPCSYVVVNKVGTMRRRIRGF